MTRIQQVQWELEMDYIGHPYYVSGNAIMHALGQQLPHDVHRHLNASHGVFVPGQFGTFPGGALAERYPAVPRERAPGRRGLRRPVPDAAGVALVAPRFPAARRAEHPRYPRPERPSGAVPRDHHGETRRRAEATADDEVVHQRVPHADRDDVLPLNESALDGLQFGGKRNYGYGITGLKDTQVVDLEALDYSRLENGEAFILELVTPFVLESEYPNAHDQDVPWWWKEDRRDLREREEKVLEQHEVYKLQTVDHGQVVAYEGDRPVETAKSSILRVGSHSKYGFGEFRVKPVEPRSNQCQNSEKKTKVTG